MDLKKIRCHQIDLSNHDKVSVNYTDSIVVHLVMNELDDISEIDCIYHHLYDIESNIFDFKLRMKQHQDRQLRK